MSLTQLFCDIDDFCQAFEEQEKNQLTDGAKKRCRRRSLSPAEIITIIVCYHQSGYRTFKWFYERYVRKNLQREFPTLVSYNRFIEFLPDVLVPLTCFMKSLCKTSENGIAFIDSTPLCVCENLRIPRHKTFNEEAERGKSSTGWFYGFKLHLLVDECGHILSFCITRGNVDDRKPVPTMLLNFIGKVFGDRGYISKKLTELLASEGVELITTLRKNMKPKALAAFDKLLLRKRSIIETINDQLKNIFDLEHSRHRSLTNYMIHIVATLVAYSYQEKKPSLNLQRKDLLPLLS